MLATEDTFRGFGPLLFCGFFACAVVSFATMAQLHRLLRERHPAIYDALGRPTSLMNNTVQNNLSVMRFILAGHFRETRDPQVIRLCRFIQIFAYTYWALFVAVVLAGFILSAR